MKPLKVKVDGFLVREKDREWIARLPEMEDDVRREFVLLYRKLVVISFVTGILWGVVLLDFLQGWIL